MMALDATAPNESTPTAGVDPHVEFLTVLYDAQCPVCRRARAWVASQSTHLPVRFVAAASQDALDEFPAIDHAATLRDITVIDGSGGIYRGDDAWIVVLWAVVATRPIANDLARGRKRRLFRSIRGATDFARSLTASVPTPAPPLVPPTPIGGFNAPAPGTRSNGSPEVRAWPAPGDTRQP